MINYTDTEFFAIYKQYIKRDGADKLMDYLAASDFFTAPASARFHLAQAGGLHLHSVNVYKRLVDLAEREFGAKYVSDNAESIAVIGLLHDLCKIRYYKTDTKNVKVDGQWVQKPYYAVEEVFPFGHGEKSVFLAQQFVKMTAEEALAINWHMGGFDARVAGGYSVSEAFYKYKLVLLTHIADLEATYLDEERG